MTEKSKNSIKKSNNTEIIDKLKHMPNESRKEIITTLEMYSGPIPHPQILKEYKNLYPEAAEKIIENGLEESRHRRNLENARQKRKGRLAWFALL